VEDAACNDVTAELTLQSSSRTLGVSVPVTPIFESEYPNLDPSVRGQSKPIGYGTTWCAPLLVDTVEEIYLVADAAYQTLAEVSPVYAIRRGGDVRRDSSEPRGLDSADRRASDRLNTGRPAMGRRHRSGPR
jgi:hypothetical protein